MKYDYHNEKEKNTLYQMCVIHSSHTCESSNGPCINNGVGELEAQFLHGELDHHIHCIGLILGEGDSLGDGG